MSKAYNNLVERFQKIYRLQHLGSIAGWDQAANMPPGGNNARSAALAELNTLLHQLQTDQAMGQWLQEADKDVTDKDTRRSLAEMTLEYQKANIIPDDLVRAQTLTSNQCEHAWRTQRADNDWTGFAKNLQEVVNLSRQEATIRAEHTGTSAYNALLELYEPGVNTQALDTLFGDLKTWLPGYIQQAKDKQASRKTIQPTGTFSQENQKALGLDVMKLLGFDFDHGRLDVSTHPFCGGVNEDVRMTTRYSEDNFVEALMGTIHETGHARYNQNLPKDNPELPISFYRSMGIHEGQSLFFEMQLGRSSEFLSLIQPLIVKHLCNGKEAPFASLDNLEKIYTEVRPGFIRVDADEITYPAHIILRYEIERDLIEGNIEVNDIPDLWQQKMKDYLGLDVAGDHKNGCMQDIHWPMGAFGYFPSYTLGAMTAAQLFAAQKKAMPDINDQIRQGNLTPIFDWLKENIWSQGRRYSTNDLMTRATGEPLNANYFQEHLKQRYL
ncbi:carboxypeptidase M32 [uncultured Endozoicomonas sp.]|uniref:carboxypeptidase M32 n=1 Tax=uncultured Endozoicomonas sp. TaxID=432652 RepID=UPI002618AF17|nr:carboxypeptidase M32 [uncultured Endozoicomonas sp.]